jgi:hypothetical protein
LVFRQPAATSGRLVFGVDDGGSTGPVIPPVDLTLDGYFPDVEFTCEQEYRSDTQRPMVASSQGGWQDAKHAPAGTAALMQDAKKHPTGWQALWSKAANAGLPLRMRQPKVLQPDRRGTAGLYQLAKRLHAAGRVDSQSGLPQYVWGLGAYGVAVPVRLRVGFKHQDGLQDRRPEHTGRNQVALPWLVGLGTDFQEAAPSPVVWDSRFQPAMQPLVGISTPDGGGGPVIPPKEPPCYAPDPHLVFTAGRALNGHLVFVCGVRTPQPTPHYVIPLLPVYMQVHHLTAHLLPGMDPVPLTDLTMAADDDGYGWSLTASGPEHLMDQLAPVAGLPAQVQVVINGMAFVFAITSTARSRSFERKRVAVQGVSVTALLGAPYMPQQSWLSTAPATAQQLAVQALEFTGVGLDWQIADWLVPAGAWSYQGTPLQAVLRVAESVGAVVRSHPTAAQLIVAPRYPVLPWHWADATPDVQMPAAVIATDELRPEPRADYNAIYVTGGSVGGVQGHVVRTLSARDKLAPAVQDDLITHADAARLRGQWALAASGNKLLHTISMPVLTGGTNPGIVRPGQLLEVVDTDGTWRGLVRGVNVSATLPRVRQQLTVERVAA